MLIRVEVRDRLTNEPIPYAVVRFAGKEAVADEYGKVTLDIAEEKLGTVETLSVRSANYEPYGRAIEVGRKKIIVRLRPEVI